MSQKKNSDDGNGGNGNRGNVGGNGVFETSTGMMVVYPLGG